MQLIQGKVSRDAAFTALVATMAMSKIMVNKELAATKAAEKTTRKLLSKKKYITQDQSLLKTFTRNCQRIQHLHPLQKRKRESHMMNKMMNP
jgi:hypothetical protein